VLAIFSKIFRTMATCPKVIEKKDLNNNDEERFLMEFSEEKETQKDTGQYWMKRKYILSVRTKLDTKMKQWIREAPLPHRGWHEDKSQDDIRG